MGCSIHLHEEIKVNGEWYHYGSPSVKRDYEVFAKMAGIRRNDIEPISEPKGMPDDATLLTQLDFEKYGQSLHDASWLGAEEISELYDWMKENGILEHSLKFIEEDYFDYLYGNAFSAFHEYGHRGSSIPEEIEDVRFVFFFDN